MLKRQKKQLNPDRRFVRKNGELNIRTRKKKSDVINDFYHTLLRMTWFDFLLLFFGFFVLINLIYGTLFSFMDLSEFDGFKASTGIEHWIESVFFSVQTFGTIGYGKISPTGTLSNLLVSIESFSSLIFTAVSTGIIFSRFSRPSAKVSFSHNAIIRDFDGIPWFMFRAVNKRQNSLTDARISVTLMMNEKNSNYRNLYPLKLEHSTTPIFAMSLIVAHEIDSNSPMHGMTLDDLKERAAEFIVSLNGVDQILSQTIYVKNSYLPEEILMEHDFVDMIIRHEDGSLTLDVEKLDKTQAI